MHMHNVTQEMKEVDLATEMLYLGGHGASSLFIAL